LFAAKVAAARAIGALSRRSGRGGGTTLPGRFLLRIAPDAIGRLGAGLERSRTIISATNGKTTTAGMLASALHAAGRDPVHNRAGSNMAWGVATALLDGGGDEGLFEVDEAWLPSVADELAPTLLVLGNLFRDQLDRYGELERLADQWAAVVAGREGRTGLVLNADDPLIADLGRDRELRRREGVTFFGIEDPAQAVPELQHAFDAKHCRRCGAPYRYERAFVGHLGHYRCPNCGADRPAPDVYATGIELQGISGSRFRVRTGDGELTIDLPLPGLYNVYNALAAIAAAGRLGIAGEQISAGLQSVRAAFGRVETIAIGERSLAILLIKNPAGANEVLRTLRLEAEQSGGRLDLCSLSTTGSPTDAMSPGSGTRTSTCSPIPLGGSTAPARAPPRWRFGSSTPAGRRTGSRSSQGSPTRSTGRLPPPTSASSRSRPTRR
jgi:UDP-N-acetylmuramyl tripeptide synthase